MNNETLSLFKTLTELPGAAGNEHQVRSFMRSQIEPLVDEVIQDGLGSLFGVRYNEEKGPKVMVAGHMDEVGFMVTSVTDKGMLRFQTLGGWWSQVLLAQRVHVVTKKGPITGVIASIPPHLLDESQRNKPMAIKNMMIDVGADSKQEVAEMGIRPGDQIVPICPFTPMANEKKILAKAWDNRYGCGLAIELLKEVKNEKLPNILYSGATVQEEVGLRGAQSAANMIKPDLFYALDASPANDTSGDKNAFGQLGKGVLLRIFDRTMVTHRGMREFILDTAETNSIPYQYFVSPGGTDAGRVHTSNNGVPSAVIGVCSRYIHTHASMIHVDDYAAAKELLVKLVRSTDQTTLDTIKQNG
ncbi:MULTISPECIES: M42 family metallopeptidase [Priestia]|jgi:putative aminopeptidase FrvX|uniref:M42 glutamyl aminopeptidase n=4 Tax=Priestia TaxID=2800373 RepID=D5DUE4_PRIM1|nr:MULTISPECIES: M42 family metallopeptidase [Priestia]AVX10700.1 M42 family peptidase [Bacillus sp. Y-01]KOP76767.1 peptidase M28 [Bacillus sp. FJAT-21351]KQU14290.1 peptidase M28 [Bacillus sp. Leaf75]KRD89107.1 peptidase M28 [Bacillus sp. Root147]KRF58071.1 peptidase M28 [Bacillus sp. Soil531]MBK0007596.1 M42 family metallopeptidase [Bacillus sp. S35]MBZ5477672.1 M42 family metallopeptidase [Bacillus sp. T_4]MCF6798701.1 M42 family metallopeptidase [Bacillus sp. ET1]MCJ7984349.1 M42 fami